LVWDTASSSQYPEWLSRSNLRVDTTLGAGDRGGNAIGSQRRAGRLGVTRQRVCADTDGILSPFSLPRVYDALPDPAVTTKLLAHG
jgi:hypothetical protein